MRNESAIYIQYICTYVCMYVCMYVLYFFFFESIRLSLKGVLGYEAVCTLPYVPTVYSLALTAEEDGWMP